MFTLYQSKTGCVTLRFCFKKGTSWCQSSNGALPDSLKERLQQLAECAEPIGRGIRWKRKIRKQGRERAYDYVSSWCNGSAGFIHLWTLAHRMFREQRYFTLAEKTAWNVWEDPDKMTNLCCGLAGRAYGLLNLYKHTGEKAWLHRAQELANRAAVGITASTLHENSLYKEQVGVAVLAADLSRPEMSSMPFFEQEGWPAPQNESRSDIR